MRELVAMLCSGAVTMVLDRFFKGKISNPVNTEFAKVRTVIHNHEHPNDSAKQGNDSTTATTSSSTAATSGGSNQTQTQPPASAQGTPAAPAAGNK